MAPASEMPLPRKCSVAPSQASARSDDAKRAGAGDAKRAGADDKLALLEPKWLRRLGMGTACPALGFYIAFPEELVQFERPIYHF